jgi:hypothetical protein
MNSSSRLAFGCLLFLALAVAGGKWWGGTDLIARGSEVPGANVALWINPEGHLSVYDSTYNVRITANPIKDFQFVIANASAGDALMRGGVNCLNDTTGITADVISSGEPITGPALVKVESITSSGSTLSTDGCSTYVYLTYEAAGQTSMLFETTQPSVTAFPDSMIWVSGAAGAVVSARWITGAAGTVDYPMVRFQVFGVDSVS